MQKTTTIILFLLLAAMQFGATCPIAYSATPPREELLVTPEYDHMSLSPEEAEILKDVEGTFLFKIKEDAWRWLVKNGWPIEAIVNYAIENTLSYVFLKDDGELQGYRIKDNVAIKWQVFDESIDGSCYPAMVKTILRRDDIFRCVEITKDIEDMEIITTYNFYGVHGKDLIMIYYVTNHGDYLYVRSYGKYDQGVTIEEPKEFLLPKDLVYEHGGNIDVLRNACGSDIEKYTLKIPSSDLPDISVMTSDHSIIFLILSLISAGGFTLFAVTKPRKKISNVTDAT